MGRLGNSVRFLKVLNDELVSISTENFMPSNTVEIRNVLPFFCVGISSF